MENETEFLSEQEILENFLVDENEFEKLLEDGVVTSHMENETRVFNFQEIKIFLEDRGHALRAKY